MKKIFIFILFYACACKAFAQDDNELTGYFLKAKQIMDHQITERTYLHFDKPYYAAGDTMYFKAYVVIGWRHEPSLINNMLHVELIDPHNKIARSLRLQLNKGFGWGDFALPDSLPPGNYRVRAYTQWMRNGGNDAFFDRTIRIASLLKHPVPESTTAKNVNAEPDLQFFPEGGDLVENIESKVAFKCIGADGLGMDIKGDIVTNDGTKITDFASAHLGMGYFTLRPEHGVVYKANVTFANGRSKTYSIPEAKESGIVLRVVQDGPDTLHMEIACNKAYFNQNYNSRFSFMLYSHALVTQRLSRLNARVIKVPVLKSELRSGISRATVLSASGEPLTERLIFAFNNDQLKVSAGADQPDYSPRSDTRLRLHIASPDDSLKAGHFSVSVVDETKVPVDENSEHTIFTDLLLTDDLKGFIEQPNYYFAGNDQKTRNDLDLVMLTHGYRRFSWADLKKDQPVAWAWQPEKDLQINGVVKSLLGKPLKSATVNLIPVPDGVPVQTKSDGKGEFSFARPVFVDSAQFILQGVNIKGGNHTKFVYKPDDFQPPVVINKIEPEADTLAGIGTYLYHARKRRDDYEMFKPQGTLLKEVKVKAPWVKKTYRSSSLMGPGFADVVYLADDISRASGPNFADNLINISTRGRVVKMLIAAKQHAKGMPLVVIDGAITNMPDAKGADIAGSGMDVLNGNDVEAVEFFMGPEAIIYGPGSNYGVIVITTKNGSERSANIASTGILPIKVAGLYKAREFYAPRYDVAANLKSRRDLRSTIYWQPEVVTDKNGDATIDYFNADEPGIYRVVVEGMDERGNIGRAVYTYNVK